MIRTIVMLASLVILAGCAKVGTLDRPAPLFGEKAKAQYRAQKAAEAAAKTKPADTTPEPLPPTPEGPEPPPVAPQ
ncbi:MAG TPA: hypothetical protein VGH15_07645 [Caulobacteraceae bacterium]|jgi:uncharacterized protein YceK